MIAATESGWPSSTEATDSNERLRSELSLSEARYRGLVDGSIQGILIHVDGVVRLANPALVRLLGYEHPARFVGNSIWPFIAPADREMVEERMRSIGCGALTPDRFELRVVKRGGALVWIECIATTIAWDAQPAVLVTMVDVTEKRVLEEQVRQAQKMEAVGRLAGGVAHDFNNLLTVINSFSDLLLEDLDASDPRREDVNYIRRAAQTGASLTRQLLAFSRQQVLEPKVLSLNEVVTNARKMLQRLVGEDIELVTSLETGDTWVRADAGELEQIIMNLAVNARDAMPDGGRLLLATASVDLDEVSARQHFGRPGRYVTLVVSDSGVGMDEPTKARIFEPFFTTKAPGKGTGLGLATVYGIVQRNGGSIWPSSELGRGTTFEIFLPRVDHPAPEAESSDRAPQGGNETVLLVEDAAAVRGALSQVLGRLGYSVLEAPDGEAALSLASKHHSAIDLLLTDLVMPGINGRKLGRKLREARPGLKVLLVSGYSEAKLTQYDEPGYGAAYLQKPFTPDVLARKVREVLDAA